MKMLTNDDLTWNSSSDELQQLIKDRLGEPMAANIASVKGGSCDLVAAIAYELFYDLKSMNNNMRNQLLAERLFPEIWPIEEVAEETAPPLEVEGYVIESPYPAEVIDETPIFIIRLEHSGDAKYVQALLELCDNYTFPVEVLTKPLSLFKGELELKLQCELVQLFRFAMTLESLEPSKIYGVSVRQS